MIELAATLKTEVESEKKETDTKAYDACAIHAVDR